MNGRPKPLNHQAEGQALQLWVTKGTLDASAKKQLSRCQVIKVDPKPWSDGQIILDPTSIGISSEGSETTSGWRSAKIKFGVGGVDRKSTENIETLLSGIKKLVQPQWEILVSPDNK